MNSLKEIEGRYFKECNVVMLPVKINTKITDLKGLLFKTQSEKLKQYPVYNKPNHVVDFYNLNIISDDEIKENDYAIYNNGLNSPGFIVKAIKTDDKMVYRLPNETWENYGHKDGGITPLLKDVKKIIATTDKSLFYTKYNVLKDTVYEQDVLPQLSQSFIKKYCELGGIDKVLVEYEDNSTCKTTGICKLYSSNTDKVCIGACNKSQLKTDSHNTITIKEVKEKMYSRKEVETILCNYFLSNVIEQDITTKEWIDKNL